MGSIIDFACSGRNNSYLNLCLIGVFCRQNQRAPFDVDAVCSCRKSKVRKQYVAIMLQIKSCAIFVMVDVYDIDSRLD